MAFKIYLLKDVPEIKTREIMKGDWAEFLKPGKTTMKYWTNMKKIFQTTNYAHLLTTNLLVLEIQSL